ncbi:MAG: hypothetical protein JST92_17745, partial [Deltaproteobacteria bacterium]|nr:hypothetical protein [Deltaproteobacteria bacterium]
TRLSASAKGFVLEADLQGSHVEARGDTPLAAALELAQTLAARARTLPLSAEEIHRWGASDEPAARAVRAMWRRRTAMVIRDYAQEPRAVLAQDPRSPFAHFMLFHVERDPATVSEARKQLLANLDRLPPDRAAAMRGYVAVADAQDAPEAGLAQLKRAYSTSPDDLDVGLLYAAALEQAHDFETLEALAGELHARWPRKSLIALHWATASDDPAASDRLVQWLVAANPEQVCSTERIELLIATGRIPEAEAACLFAQKLGVALTDRYIPETLIAFTSGDPTRIDRITVPTLAWTNSWPQTVAARLRLNGLLLTGRVAAAGSALRAQFAGAKASGATARALRAGTDLMTLHRRAGAAPLSSEDLDWMERTLDASPPALLTTASARTELALARDRAGRKLSDSRKALDALDAELVRRAAGDSMTLVRARLRTLPLVRLVLGSAKASDLWRASMSVPLGDKLQFAFEAALALDASDADTEAEQAFAVTITPIQLVEHAFDSEAARLRLADLYLATGREAQARPLLEQLDRAWSVADPGLRLKIRALR